MVIGGILAASSAIAFARQPQVHYRAVDPTQFEGWVPRQVASWKMTGASGVVLPPPDSLVDRLYDNLVTRVYTSPTHPAVMFLMAYNHLQDGVVQVHRPEVCYPVGGFQLSKTESVEIPVRSGRIPANFFTARGPKRVEQVLYFTRLGDAYPRSWSEQRMTVMRANLAGRIPDGMMMRLSLLGSDPSAALRILNRFAAEFISTSPIELRRLLLT
jgi:EpsI family protein